jgi:dolichol-phosphate mannosyltransferase
VAVGRLVEEVAEHASKLKIPFEIILVNDHSSDGSETAITEQCQRHPFVKGITLCRTYGQQVAISAGMQFCRGRYVLIMDGDLQNPPSEIPRLYEKIKEGHDVVYTRSKIRNDFWDRITSWLFWSVVTRILGLKMIRDQLMMKIMTASFVENYNRYREVNRVVAGIVQDIGMKYAVSDITNRKRISGRSNYHFFSRLELALDMILALSNRPLNWMIYLGGVSGLIFSILAFGYFIKHFIYNVPPGYTSLILSICLFGSLNLTMVGIIGRYLSNIYAEVRNRPLFFVQKKFNL